MIIIINVPYIFNIYIYNVSVETDQTNYCFSGQLGGHYMISDGRFGGHLYELLVQRTAVNSILLTLLMIIYIIIYLPTLTTIIYIYSHW